MKNKLIILIVLMSALLAGCFNWHGVRGNGIISEDYRDIESFDAMDVSGAFTVYVIVGEPAKLKITGDENLLKYVRTRIKGNKLIIDTKKNFKNKNDIRIDISTPYLEDLDISGANTVKIRGIDSERFKTDLSGACKILLEGRTNKLIADISGASSFDAENLEADYVKIECSGASKASVFAVESIDADVSGVGSVTFKGDPENVRTDVSGVGSIKRK
ncbi:MAG: hypothetical protein CVV23_09685 [Ignavibacteriae bacterium HGW-Ignavibacteriae-2]|jgi:hypothetical protein|nr:DUF2807 domain-containing protein [Bacteroidota bacterium]PKL88556.1 MAG: hypothetical protein CVV23_09685 [Ignavibacteriae bacterium HGW-Ignavibacteriae-2]